MWLDTGPKMAFVTCVIVLNPESIQVPLNCLVLLLVDAVNTDMWSSQVMAKFQSVHLFVSQNPW